MTTIILIVVLVFVIETSLLVLLGKLTRQVHKENLELKDEVSRQKRNVSALVNHAQKLSEITEDKDNVNQLLHGAQSDEELSQIINSIIALNNNRVQNNTKK